MQKYKSINDLSSQAIKKYNDTLTKMPIPGDSNFVVMWRAEKLGSTIHLEVYKTIAESLQRMYELGEKAEGEKVRWVFIRHIRRKGQLITVWEQKQVSSSKAENSLTLPQHQAPEMLQFNPFDQMHRLMDRYREEYQPEDQERAETTESWIQSIFG